MTRYELKSDYGWKQLIHLMDTLKNQTGAIEAILDVDRVLWMLAFNDVLVNLDLYTGAFAQNYYLYYDENGRWIPIVWDLNMSFGAFSSLSLGGGGGGLSIAQMQQMDPLVQSGNASFPGDGGVPGITLLMNARNTFLSANANLTTTAPAISAVTATPAVALPGKKCGSLPPSPMWYPLPSPTGPTPGRFFNPLPCSTMATTTTATVTTCGGCN